MRKPCYWVMGSEQRQDEDELMDGENTALQNMQMMQNSTKFRITDFQLLADFIFFETSGAVCDCFQLFWIL